MVAFCSPQNRYAIKTQVHRSRQWCGAHHFVGRAAELRLLSLRLGGSFVKRYGGFTTHRIHVWYIYILYANIKGVYWWQMLHNVTIYSIYGSYGQWFHHGFLFFCCRRRRCFFLRRQKHRGIERDYWVAFYRKGVATVFAMQIWAANKSSLWVESFSGWSRKSRGHIAPRLRAFLNEDDSRLERTIV